MILRRQNRNNSDAHGDCYANLMYTMLWHSTVLSKLSRSLNLNQYDKQPVWKTFKRQ